MSQRSSEERPKLTPEEIEQPTVYGQSPAYVDSGKALRDIEELYEDAKATTLAETAEVLVKNRETDPIRWTIREFQYGIYAVRKAGVDSYTIEGLATIDSSNVDGIEAHLREQFSATHPDLFTEE